MVSRTGVQVSAGGSTPQKHAGSTLPCEGEGGWEIQAFSSLGRHLREQLIGL